MLVQIPDDCPDALAALMRRCWSSKATERPGFREISVLLVKVRNGFVVGGGDSLRPIVRHTVR